LFGVFDRIDIGKEELANAPDWLPIKLFVNGERFRLDHGKISTLRKLMHKASLVRYYTPGSAWCDEGIQVASKPACCLADRAFCRDPGESARH